MMRIVKAIGVLVLTTGTAWGAMPTNPAPLSVSVTNTPMVDVLSMPPVTVGTLPDINIATMPNVNIATMPNVNVATMPNVNVATMPSVTIANPSLTITAPEGMSIPVQHRERRFAFTIPLHPHPDTSPAPTTLEVTKSGLIETISLPCHGQFANDAYNNADPLPVRFNMYNMTAWGRDSAEIPFGGSAVPTSKAPRINFELGQRYYDSAQSSEDSEKFQHHMEVLGALPMVVQMPIFKRDDPNYNHIVVSLEMHWAHDLFTVCDLTLTGYFID